MIGPRFRQSEKLVQCPVMEWPDHSIPLPDLPADGYNILWRVRSPATQRVRHRLDQAGIDRECFVATQQRGLRASTQAASLESNLLHQLGETFSQP